MNLNFHKTIPARFFRKLHQFEKVFSFVPHKNLTSKWNWKTMSIDCSCGKNFYRAKDYIPYYPEKNI